MHVSAASLKAFYESKIGQVVRRILQRRLREIWPDVEGLSCVGLGYAAPYMPVKAQRSVVFMNAETSAHCWPCEQNAANRAALIDPAAIPVGAERFDRAIMIHHLEHIQKLKDNLQEAWHILRPHGRLLVIVPNRHGLWARADWSPFGSGMPFSLSQILYYLESCDFKTVQVQEALFLPPRQRGLPLKFAAFLEQSLRYCLPVVAGVHLIEVQKEVHNPQGTRAPVTKLRTAGLFPAGAS